MEPTAPSEAPPKKTITLEAPEYLEREQNFYDQAPFAGLIERTVEDTGREKSVVELILGDVAATLRSENNSTDETPAKDKVHPSVTARLIGRKVARFVRLGSATNDFSKIALNFMGSLPNYPYSAEYLSEQRKGHLNNARNTTKFDMPTESYAFWVAKKLDREGRLKMKGIEEIFPQTLDNVGVGKKSASRKWTILHASELRK